MYNKHLDIFTSWDTSVNIIINLGLLLTFVGAHNDSNIHHPGRLRRESDTVCGTKPQLDFTHDRIAILQSGEFPWHVIIHQINRYTRKKEFLCGATIIADNLLLTAAHCVFNKITKKAANPDNFIIAIGWVHRTPDIDFWGENQTFTRDIKGAKVKNIYMNCGYQGLAGNYARDIAILHIEPSINFTSYLMPICLEPNLRPLAVVANEQITGFNGFPERPREYLRKSLVQAMARNVCIEESKEENARKFVTADKICAGFSNLPGRDNFTGNPGSGLVFEYDDVWYINGVQSIGLGRDRPGCTKTTCDNRIVALFTDVSFYTEWIRDVMSQVAQGKPVPECSEGSKNEGTPPTTRKPVTTPRPLVCPSPPGIQNGHWKLHSSQCPSNNDHCEPRKGMNMVPGTHLVYICNQGYQLTDVGDVYCASGGRWSNIPQCREIRCKVLDTSSTKADCSLNGEWTSCATPALPRTRAEVSCRTSYRQEDSVLQRNRVTCNFQGQWEPEPIKCIPVCGIKPSKNVRPLVVNGQTPVTTDFPWHATIYRTSSNSTEKKFICGATVITENLLITAAHCVFDEGIKKPDNPRKFFIATGNFFRDYNFEYPPPIVVRKAQVKKIYMNCDYQGLDGNYDRDIAILHIEPSINFTSYLMPICLDTKIKSLAIDLGINGVVAGFGRTAEGFASSILQSLSVPVVPKSVCIQESNEVNFQRFVTADKFCAGYKNGSSVCDGDSGGGLTFETNNLWYIRGIVSSGLGTTTTGGTRTCDNTRYAIYTEISFYISWIQEIMLKVEQNQAILECSTRTRRHMSDSNREST